jgi:hypothetical protein
VLNHARPIDDTGKAPVSCPRMNVELMLDWLDGHCLKLPEFEEVRRLLAEKADSKTVVGRTKPRFKGKCRNA